MAGSAFRPLTNIPHCCTIHIGVFPDPMWSINLSVMTTSRSQLSHYLNYYLLGNYINILKQALSTPFVSFALSYKKLYLIFLTYYKGFGFLYFKVEVQLFYSPLHHSTLQLQNEVRLACVKPLDSVQSEPSSNSLFTFYFHCYCSAI